MEKLVLSFFLLLSCAATIRAQGMRPYYTYLHEALVYPGSSPPGSIMFREEISGYTDCNRACPPGVVHTPYIQVVLEEAR